MWEARVAWVVKKCGGYSPPTPPANDFQSHFKVYTPPAHSHAGVFGLPSDGMSLASQDGGSCE